MELRPRGRAVRLRTGSDPERSLRDWRTLEESGVLERVRAGEVDLRFEGQAVLRRIGKPEGGEEGVQT